MIRGPLTILLRERGRVIISFASTQATYRKVGATCSAILPEDAYAAAFTTSDPTDQAPKHQDMLSRLQAPTTPRSRLLHISTHVRMMGTMKEALVSRGPKVRVVDSPIPKPGPGQVLIKVVAAGSNPKDWKRPEYWGSKAVGNQGDDMAGVVHAVGEGVSEFKPGDRVAAFHEMAQPGGSYAEYGISWAYTTFHLPANNSFEEGAAIPLAALTAACGLYARLGLPQPWMPVPTAHKIPLVIWGASSAVGSYAIQLVKRSNIHPLICIAGRAQAHTESLIDRSKGDVVIDYRQGHDVVSQAIKASLKGAKLEHAFDAVSEMGSFQTICEVLDKDTGKITLIVPAQSYSDIPKTIEKSVTKVADINAELKDFGYVYSRYFSKGLEEGWFKAQPQEVVPGGLEGVQTGLQNLKRGVASAVKYVYRIADTPGVGTEK